MASPSRPWPDLVRLICMQLHFARVAGGMMFWRLATRAWGTSPGPPRLGHESASCFCQWAKGIVEYKLWDKNSAADKLMKHLGLRARDNAQTSCPIQALLDAPYWIDLWPALHDFENWRPPPEFWGVECVWLCLVALRLLSYLVIFSPRCTDMHSQSLPVSSKISSTITITPIMPLGK